MKKLLSLLLVLSLLLAVFAGCEDKLAAKYQNSKKHENTLTDVKDEKKPVESDAKVLSSSENVSDTATDNANKPPVNNNTKPPVSGGGTNSKPPSEKAAPPSDKPSFISEAKAKEIALQRAGLSAKDVIFERVELDRDDGIWEYEIEFRQGRVEYDVDVKADDGKVLSFEKDMDD